MALVRALDRESRPPRRSELLCCLAQAADLAMGQPSGQALRTCLLAARIAEALDVEDDELADVHHVALLRWIGCTANAHEFGKWFADEITSRASAALVDPLRPSAGIAFAVRHIGAGDGPLTRTAKLARATTQHARITQGATLAHCEVAEMLAVRLGLPGSVAGGLRQVFERWDGRGHPAGLAAGAISRSVAIVQVAADAELFSRVAGPDTAVRVVRDRAGTVYDPACAAAFLDDVDAVLDAADVPSAWSRVLEIDPAPPRVLTASELDAGLEVAADFADLKSPFFTGHSRAVARLAGEAAAIAGLGSEDVLDVRRAALLHDLGRAALPANVWEKPGALTDDERERVRLYPYYTERVVARAPRLDRLGRLARMHAERLDGSGYPHGLDGPQLPGAARILAAADVYRALVEPRPHRAAHATREAADVVGNEVRSGRLDAGAVAAVLEAAGHGRRAASSNVAGLTSRELEVLRHVARGATNREIAEALVISSKTAGNHVASIYAKTGVSTRAAATLFAVQHQLL